MREKSPVNPNLPTLPTSPALPLLAGFPPTLVGFRTHNPVKQPPLVTKGPSKAHVTIAAELCKGCELCVLACPSGNLALSDQLNRNGYHPVVFTYEGTRGPCSACGICYWVCPDFSISEIRRIRQ
jgi:2-oxoglutarate ferredoxin oxidoreductase subunit delta